MLPLDTIPRLDAIELLSSVGANTNAIVIIIVKRDLQDGLVKILHSPF